MAKINLQQRYIKGRFNLPIVTLICLLTWIGAHYLGAHTDPEALVNTANWGYSEYPLDLPIWLNQIIAFAGYGILAYLLIILNNTFSIINLRATVQSTTFLILIATIPQIHYIYPGLASTILILAASHFFFQTYKVYDSSELYYYIGFFWGLSFLILPKTIFLFPLFLLAAIPFSSVNIRTFFSALLGIITPIWIMFCYCYLTDSMYLFYIPFTDLFSWGNLEAYKSLDGNNLITFVFALTLVILSITYLLLSQPRMKIKTYYILNYFFVLSIGLIVIMIFNPIHFYQYIPLCIAGVSFIFSNVLVTYQNKMSNIIFMITLGILLMILATNIWMPLYNS